MAVKYKYSGELEIIIDDANNYSIETIPNSPIEFEALGTYDDLIEGRTNIFIARLGNSSEFELTTFPIAYAGGRTFNTFTDTETGEVYQTDYPNYQNWRTGNTFVRRYTVDDNDFARIYDEIVNDIKRPGIRFGRRGYLIERGLKVFTSVVERIGTSPNYNLTKVYEANNFNLLKIHPSQIGNLYKLNIILDGLIIYSRTETYRPEYVERIGRECSSDTCAVLCGDTVCCYSSDGRATESFNLSESIY
jgi:hypothetical protein